jgi:hypothetical protein
MEPNATNQTEPNTTPAPQTQTALGQAVPSIPDSWPGAFGAYKYSKAAVLTNWVVLLILFILSGVVSSIFSGKFKNSGGEIISLVISSFFAAAYTFVFIAGVRRNKMSLEDSFKQALPVWLKMIGLTILVTLSAVVSLILLVIPFFFVFPRLVLANYYLVDKKLGIIDAYKASWNVTKGNVGKIYGIVGAGIVMALPLITIIGITSALYFLFMYSAAFAVLYEYIKEKTPAVVAEQTPATPPAA